MTYKEFNDLVERRLIMTREVMASKNKEYATVEDSLHNFKKAAGYGAKDETPQQALWGMLKKHLVSIHDLIESRSEHISKQIIDEKIGDIINYFILLEALFEEDGRKIPGLSCDDIIVESFEKAKEELHTKQNKESGREITLEDEIGLSNEFDNEIVFAFESNDKTSASKIHKKIRDKYNTLNIKELYIFERTRGSFLYEALLIRELKENTGFPWKWDYILLRKSDKSDSTHGGFYSRREDAIDAISMYFKTLIDMRASKTKLIVEGVNICIVNNKH